jgi:hypothetical protein
VKTLTLAGALSASVAASLVADPASADAPPPPPLEPVAAAGDDHVVDELLAPDGIVLETRRFDPEGREVVVAADGTLLPIAQPADSGSGGSPSAEGCRRVTVRNEVETLLGATAYWYNTFTEWCWNRANHLVGNVVTGHFFEDVDPNFLYRELLVQDERHYAWVEGFNKSGFWHERQARWENCLFRVGCVGNTFPRNVLRSHADGTWNWSTNQ